MSDTQDPVLNLDFPSETPAPDIDQLRRDGLAAFEKSRFEDAAEAFGKWVEHYPNSDEALFYHGYALSLMGEWDKALAALDRALAIESRNYAPHMHKALTLLMLKQLTPALQSIETAISLAPGRVDVLAAAARVLMAMGRLDEAEETIVRAFTDAPSDPEVLVVVAAILTARERHEDAANVRGNLLVYAPDFPKSLAARALSLERRGRQEEALAISLDAQKIAPNEFDVLNVLGMVYANLKRYPEAIEAYRGAVMVRPDSADTWVNLGLVSSEDRKWLEAEFAYNRAIEIDPKLVTALRNHAYIMGSLSAVGAVVSFKRALEVDPDHASLLSGLRMNKAISCDWEDIDPLVERLRTDIETEGTIADPFEGLAFFGDGATQLRCIRHATMTNKAMLNAAPLDVKPTYGDKIRVGYLSADFHTHPVSQLMEPVWNARDRSQFEIVAFSALRKPDCVVQKRLRDTFDEFHDVDALDLVDLANLIAAHNIEILVDLSGFTRDSRTHAMGWRPAPVQVNFLGFSGTMGGDFVDYIIGDPVLIPPGSEDFYAEKVVRLPDTYMPSNPRTLGKTPTRAECNLPENAIVFCSFSAGYKIRPEMFAGWMRILEAVPGSVLWLPEKEGFQGNLVPRAIAHGIAPERLIFAEPTANQNDHFARLSLADIMLDTSPYGAHTTANDGLWCGVPVITLSAESFASRVAKSLLTAVGLPELDRADMADYEAFAIALAKDPERLAALKAHLVDARDTSPLFDVARFTRHYEAALKEMSARSRRGEAPASFDVPVTAG